MDIRALSGFTSVRKYVKTGDLVRGHMTEQTINQLRRWSKKGLLTKFFKQGVKFNWPRDPETVYLVIDDFCVEIKGNHELNSIPDFLGIKWLKCMSPDGQTSIYDARMMQILQKCEDSND